MISGYCPELNCWQLWEMCGHKPNWTEYVNMLCIVNEHPNSGVVDYRKMRIEQFFQEINNTRDIEFKQKVLAIMYSLKAMQSNEMQFNKVAKIAFDRFRLGLDEIHLILDEIHLVYEVTLHNASSIEEVFARRIKNDLQSFRESCVQQAEKTGASFNQLYTDSTVTDYFYNRIGIDLEHSTETITSWLYSSGRSTEKLGQKDGWDRVRDDDGNIVSSREGKCCSGLKFQKFLIRHYLTDIKVLPVS